MTIRHVSYLLLAAGLTLGSAVDRPPSRTPARIGDRTVLTADLHVHAFPGDGVLPAWELRREARRRGVDVIAITNHNQSIAASLPAGGDTAALPLVIRGQEITSPLFHMVAANVRQVVDWRLPAREAIAAVQGQGGIAIAAHPVKDSWMAEDEAALRTIDGTEAVHALGEAHSRGRYQLREFHRTARAANPTVAAIGSSDFHGIAPLGRCISYVLVDEISEAGVLDAIRHGRTVASDTRGTFVGDPALVAQVKESGAANVERRQPDALARLSVWLVLSALAMLVCVR